MDAAVMDKVIEQYRIGTEPYYRPVGDEVQLFEAAYAVRMPMMLTDAADDVIAQLLSPSIDCTIRQTLARPFEIVIGEMLERPRSDCVLF